MTALLRRLSLLSLLALCGIGTGHAATRAIMEGIQASNNSIKVTTTTPVSVAFTNYVSSGPIMDVRAWGADPTGVLDSKPAIQAAVNYATATASGGAVGATVYLPKGVYKINSAVTISGARVVVQLDPGTQVLFSTTDNGFVFNAADYNSGLVGGQIETSTSCYHNGSPCPMSTGAAVWFNGFPNFFLRDTEIHGGNACVKISTGAYGGDIYHDYMYGCSTGIAISNSASAIDIHDSQFYAMVNNVVTADGTTFDIRFISNYGDSNNNGFSFIKNSVGDNYWKIIGNQFNANSSTNDVVLNGLYATVVGNDFLSPSLSTHTCVLINGNNNHVADNVFIGGIAGTTGINNTGSNNTIGPNNFAGFGGTQILSTGSNPSIINMGNGTTNFGPAAPVLATALEVSSPVSPTVGLLHVRPPSGSAGYITYTESGVADRGAMGFDAGSGTFNIWTNGVLNNGTKALSIDTSQRVGINQTSPATSSMLDIVSTARGALVPRMTTAQKNAIASPATGLLLYDSTLNALENYNGISWVSAGAIAVTSQTFTSGSGTYTTPAGVLWIKVRCVGGGGGGGGGATGAAGNTSAGAGGGGGGYVETIIASPAASYSYAVGGAGGGGAAGNNAGNAGGNTTFSTLAANGGAGGNGSGVATGLALTPSSGSSAGAGGTASGGNQANVPGGTGGVGKILSGAVAIAGYGGNSRFGIGAPEVGANGNSVNGAAGTNYGSGGGGGAQGNGSAAAAGGSGAAGYIVVEEHYN